MAFEFIQKAQDLNLKKHQTSLRWMSEKLDGHFALWDGGITRGLPKSEVPWANLDGDARFKIAQYSTGLWTSYANVYHAPIWWLNTLPSCPLVGELYMEGHRQDLSSIIKKMDGSSDWSEVKFHVFDIPSYSNWLQNREVKNTNYKKKFFGFVEWAMKRPNIDTYFIRPIPFNEVLGIFINTGYWGKVIEIVPQIRLDETADEVIKEFLDRIMSKGGEGIVLRNDMAWYPTRNFNAVRVKPLKDMEGTVVGYTAGRETDKGSKLLGKMGALILQLDSGVRLELSGFTDEERLLNVDGYAWALVNPGKELPEHIEASNFPRGSRVTFKYRCLTKDGVPQEARYWRKRDDD